ncbi:MAG: hypothetical protein P3A28_09925, partial [Gemmatimonadota bacterium]|nr:hypothetical protein [Gemmatimonadota bacterium]
MYRTCIFCHAPLGRNEAIEAFPVGRRLAFDAEKGRLWVVCGACARWNLTPLEARWEAIEECERLFRDTRLRTSTGQVGLARIREGTTLVRIGNPLRPEMAAWRYGERFQRRRRRYFAVGAATVVGVGAIVIGGPLAGLLSWGTALNVFNYANLLGLFGSRVKLPVGARLLTVKEFQLSHVVIRPGSGQGFELEIPHKYDGSRRERWKKFGLTFPDPQSVIVHGDEAIRAARHLLPRINRSGG